VRNVQEFALSVISVRDQVPVLLRDVAEV